MNNTFKLDDGDDISPLFKELVVNVEKTKMTEDCFKQNFLPFFAGQVNFKDAETYSNFYNNWVQIAGTPMNKVDVIDNANRVIFTVPALIDTNVVKSLVKPNKSFTEMIEEYNVRKNSISGNSDNILKRDFDNKVDEPIDPKSVYSETEKTWNQIFDRYGIKHDNVVAGSPKDDPEVDDMIYE